MERTTAVRWILAGFVLCICIFAELPAGRLCKGGLLSEPGWGLLEIVEVMENL